MSSVPVLRMRAESGEPHAQLCRRKQVQGAIAPSS
jgi:hypothetical protein